MNNSNIFVKDFQLKGSDLHCYKHNQKGKEEVEAGFGINDVYCYFEVVQFPLVYPVVATHLCKACAACAGRRDCSAGTFCTVL